MAYIYPIIQYIGYAAAAVSAVSTIQNGQEQRRQAEFQASEADIAAHEATIAGNIAATNANQAELDAQTQWEDTMRARDRMLGSNKTAAAKSGLVLTGTILDVNNDTALSFASTANRELFSGLNGAGNYRAESASQGRSALNMTRSASNYRVSGRNAVTSSYLSASGQLLSGIGDVASRGVSDPGINSKTRKSSSVRGP